MYEGNFYLHRNLYRISFILFAKSDDERFVLLLKQPSTIASNLDMLEIFTSLVNWYLTHLGQVLTGILGYHHIHYSYY